MIKLQIKVGVVPSFYIDAIPEDTLETIGRKISDHFGLKQNVCNIVRLNIGNTMILTTPISFSNDIWKDVFDRVEKQELIVDKVLEDGMTLRDYGACDGWMITGFTNIQKYLEREKENEKNILDYSLGQWIDNGRKEEYYKEVRKYFTGEASQEKDTIIKFLDSGRSINKFIQIFSDNPRDNLRTMLGIMNTISKTIGSFNTKFCAQNLSPNARDNYQKLEKVLFDYLMQSRNKEAIKYISGELLKDYTEYLPKSVLTDQLQDIKQELQKRQ